jgi:soluble P-type ATPase
MTVVSSGDTNKTELKNLLKFTGVPVLKVNYLGREKVKIRSKGRPNLKKKSNNKLFSVRYGIQSVNQEANQSR